MKTIFDRMLDIIDVDWIADNPQEAYELIQGLIHELKARKDCIQVQRKKELMLVSMIEELREKNHISNNANNKQKQNPRKASQI